MQPESREPDDADESEVETSAAAEERAWQAIVDNYGERPELDDPAPPATPDVPFGGRFGDPRVFTRIDSDYEEDADDPFLGADAEEEGYVPPPPPPVPRTTPDRLAAWIGVFGSPIILLLALIFSITLPTWMAYLMIAGFVGGFLYLVVKMPREPREPWDDGAQV